MSTRPPSVSTCLYGSMVQPGGNKHRNNVNGHINLTVVQLVSRTQSSIALAVNTRGQRKQHLLRGGAGVGGLFFTNTIHTDCLCSSLIEYSDTGFILYSYHADRLGLFLAHTPCRLTGFILHSHTMQGRQTGFIPRSHTIHTDRLGLFLAHTPYTQTGFNSSLIEYSQTGLILDSPSSDSPSRPRCRCH